MTPNQHKFFYLKHWTPCARACQWNTQAGIWGPGRAAVSPEDAQRLAQVVAHAYQFAKAQHRGPKPDDFRHACHIIALGKNKSSLDFTNDEVERIVCLFRVLAAPDDLDAIMDWDDPARAKKKNLIVQAQAKAPEAYIATIVRDRYRRAGLDDLTIPQLLDLCRLLNQRKAAWAGKSNHEDTKPTKPQPAYVTNPF